MLPFSYIATQVNYILREKITLARQWATFWCQNCHLHLLLLKEHTIPKAAKLQVEEYFSPNYPQRIQHQLQQQTTMSDTKRQQQVQRSTLLFDDSQFYI